MPREIIEPLATLYSALAESAPEDTERGETQGSKTKETIDNDVEAFADEHDVPSWQA
jgi:hypothetical protein